MGLYVTVGTMWVSTSLWENCGSLHHRGSLRQRVDTVGLYITVGTLLPWEHVGLYITVGTPTVSMSPWEHFGPLRHNRYTSMLVYDGL